MQDISRMFGLYIIGEVDEDDHCSITAINQRE